MTHTGRSVGLALAAALLVAGAGCRSADRRELTVAETGWFAGAWISDTLPTTVGAGRVARLEVRPDTQAALTIEWVRRGTTVHSGFWHARGTEFTFQPVDQQRRPTILPLVWRLEAERLVPVRWNRDLYGEAGITLRRWVPPADSAAADTTTREGPR